MGASIFIHNRMLDKQSPDITAYEAIFKKKPNLTNWKILACEACVHIPDQKRTVWDAKREKRIFVGYATSSSNYRLYNEEKRSIIIGHNVTLNEPSCGPGPGFSEQTIENEWTVAKE
jgi:hypothetical protein